MGRAIKWLKSLFGIKNDAGQKGNPNSGGRNEMKRSSKDPSGRETNGLCRNPYTIPPNITPAEAAWLRSFYCESEKEQSKHAIAVAAATAAAADAAVAAAQAAVAVVRLTSQGRGAIFGGSRENWAAIKIQNVFRGYLARKALRALKGLVKLQARVRGYLVRKQATATLHSMQALIRAQANVRAQRTRGLIKTREISQPQFQARKSVERFDEAVNQYKSLHSKRLSTSFDSMNTNAIDESPKIVEVDTGRPKSRSKRSNTRISDSGYDSSVQTLSASCPCRPPPCISIPDCRNFQDSEWGLTGDECRGFSTAKSTPRFANSCGTNTPVTPAKSVCTESLFRSYANFPSYMANTQSFQAKLRSHSAPKQRPEPGSKRKLSLHEMVESRNSLSEVRMQRSCSQVQEVLYFKNAVLGKLGKSSEFARENHRDY